MEQSASHKDCHQKKNRDREWLLGEILCNLYIGLGRYQRGENWLPDLSKTDPSRFD